MKMTVREAFERGTETFNAHGFADVLADDVVFEAPRGMRGEGKPTCLQFYGSWVGAFPDAHIEVHRVHIIDDVAVEEGTFTEEPLSRAVSQLLWNLRDQGGTKKNGR
jgi:hypothetical protein